MLADGTKVGSRQVDDQTVWYCRPLDASLAQTREYPVRTMTQPSRALPRTTQPRTTQQQWQPVSAGAEGPSDDACSDDEDNPMLACMPTPEALARLVKYADSLPGAAALIAAASQHVERTVLVV